MGRSDTATKIGAETLAVFQPRARRQLGEEDARQMVENVTGFFDLLARWASAGAAPAPQPCQRDGQRLDARKGTRHARRGS